ncbi:phage baseplate protein [Actinacidiphila bryophytorum]|uniref:phage baseplate protein n=1 Tax=Actinacidiphila bryophytorum TaxID=1436133 RepID=UPI002176BA19|nr:hypothetical protein [Actinacidiphila bryophytorum]UWE12957.1 hypothetical protein NYE86_32630 [Actinacidiphila bryophytorum]
MHQQNRPKHSASRRRLLRLGGAVAVAAAVGATVPFIHAGDAQATVDNSSRFKLDGAGGNPILLKSLAANWVLQSFAYDNTHQHIYFVQVNSVNTDPDHVGDLWITKTDTAGRILGSMALHRFGHGVSIGVEPSGSGAYLWTEWKSSAGGFGTKIGRFKFVDGATLAPDSAAVQDRTPQLTGVHSPQAAIDPSTDRVWYRYKTSTGDARIVGYKLADAVAGRLTSGYRLAERALPSRGSWGDANPFQGYAVYGRYAYLLEGVAKGDAYISVIDLNASGQSLVVDRWPTTAGQSLSNREPEGMAIWLSPAGPRLAFGFESNTGGKRQASVFYKSQFV